MFRFLFFCWELSIFCFLMTINTIIVLYGVLFLISISWLTPKDECRCRDRVGRDISVLFIYLFSFHLFDDIWRESHFSILNAAYYMAMNFQIKLASL